MTCYASPDDVPDGETVALFFNPDTGLWCTRPAEETDTPPEDTPGITIDGGTP